MDMRTAQNACEGECEPCWLANKNSDDMDVSRLGESLAITRHLPVALASPVYRENLPADAVLAGKP